jgi:hypothetical protein
MPKKRRKSVKKNSVRKTSGKANLKRSTKRKISLVSKNLISFLIFFIVSFILYFVSKGGIYEDLFLLISFILGAITLTFLIVFLALIFLKGMKK